ncbi:ABC transporter ATP-binding protein [Granulicella cerasi]|uniref:ABC transporter ATP-binding protein n=1 Tax=Granulicella cerasi TaxID=741063 RepID=A0ABW1Z3V9_9BACT|nr:ABC transporter ATP-binding protein [Granulicella cerasi]
MPPLLQAEGLTQRFASPGANTAALELFRQLSLTVEEGEMVSVVGESGAGKSSLLHLLAALEKPSEGSILIGGRDITQLSAAASSAFRNTEIGYVWQFHYLLPEFSALENIALPLLARGVAQKEATSRAKEWLARVGLADRAAHRSGELSGGEQQRISIARALVTEPKLLLADEPTGDLDNTTAESVFTLLQELHRERRLTSVLVTHNLDFAARCDRSLRLVRGQLVAAG